jgi:chaperonin cofactor prefoldin
LIKQSDLKKDLEKKIQILQNQLNLVEEKISDLKKKVENLEYPPRGQKKDSEAIQSIPDEDLP